MTTVKSSIVITLLCISNLIAGPRQDSQFSNVYYAPDVTFHDARQPKQKCLFLFATNTFFNHSYLNLKTVVQIMRKYGIGNISKTLYTLTKLMYEKRTFKKDPTQPEGFVWDALLEKYDTSTPEQKMIINNLRLLTSHISSIDIQMAQLLYDLHGLGHDNRITSMIGKQSLDLVISNLKDPVKKQPSIPAVDYCTKITLSKHAILPSKKNNWMSPAQPGFYSTLSEKNKSNKKRIYVDTNRKHVVAAVAAGFDIGIVFKNHDNLIKILTALNIRMPQQIA